MRAAATLAGVVALIAGCPAEDRASPAAAAEVDTEPTSLSAWTERLQTLEVRRLGPDHRPIGEVAALSALIRRGQPSAVAFFATYCPPCIDEMPALNAMHAEGAAIVGVSLDVGNEAELAALLDRHAVGYPTALLTEVSMKRAGKALGGLPMTVLVGSGGSVRGLIRSRADRATLAAALRLAATSPDPPILE